MFCPSCGAADQTAEIFCRQCGKYLPNLDKPAKRRHTPEERLKANSILNLLSAVVSITLAIALYSVFLGKEGTPLIIYITAGFLGAIFGWQVVIFWQTMLLKRHFRKNNPQSENASVAVISASTAKLLDEADLKDAIPRSITENTTRQLREKVLQDSSQTEH